MLLSICLEGWTLTVRLFPCFVIKLSGLFSSKRMLIVYAMKNDAILFPNRGGKTKALFCGCGVLFSLLILQHMNIFSFLPKCGIGSVI